MIALGLFKAFVSRYKTLLWLVLVLALVGALLYGLHALHQNGVDQGRAEMKLAWDKANQAQLTDQLAREKQARDQEKTLVANMATIQKKANHEKNISDTRLRNLLEQLRQRPERTAGQLAGELPPAAPSGAGCTGAGLARPDGEFLARYAADAQRLNVALDQCKAAYDATRSISNGAATGINK